MPPRHPHPENAELVHEAEHDVDHAWEVYHRAALGGTVASPALQAQIEQHLHEARTLVTQAQEAAERGDESQSRRRPVGEVKHHTTQAIAGKQGAEEMTQGLRQEKSQMETDRSVHDGACAVSLSSVLAAPALKELDPGSHGDHSGRTVLDGQSESEGAEPMSGRSEPWTSMRSPSIVWK